MDYGAWTIRQLQQECKARGLPSGRAKAELVQRLADVDAAGEQVLPQATQTAAPEAPAEAIPSPDTFPLSAPADPSAGLLVAPNRWRCEFPAGAEPPGEEDHLAYRQHTIQAAIDAGHTPRGDAFRTGTADGRDVYEVHVRAVT